MKFKVDKTIVASVALHVLVIGWGLITFSTRALEVVPEALPVDIISSADLSKMTAGMKNGDKDKPKPLVEKVADAKPVDDLSHITLLRTLLILNVVIMIGYALDEAVAETGVKLPLFVICLLVGIVATNTIPRLVPGMEWPTRTRALALISDLALNVFLAMSLMSMQLG